jgi:peptide/nickel transport system permease protein
MFAYLIRRLLYAVPIVLGVMLITFVLFFVVQSPEALARRVLGPKASPKTVANWMHNRGYDKPLLINRNVRVTFGKDTPAEAGRPGLKIGFVNGSSPEETAGLLPNDRLLSIDGKTITSSREFEAHSSSRQSGQTATLQVTREDKTLDLTVSYAEPASWHDSLFFAQLQKLARFEFGKSDITSRDLSETFKAGAIPSLLITVPAFLVGLVTSLAIALFLVLLRNSLLDTLSTVACVALMSVPSMVYIITGQYLAAIQMRLFPAFGFDLAGLSTAKFLLLPVLLMVVSGLGAEVRIYRAIFLEEIEQDYVRTARAKGLSNQRVLFVHVLKNGLINLITLVVASLPFLVMGSLVVENFFGIPGLGNVLFSAILGPDFAVVQASVFLGSLLYLAGLVATDVCYALVDPRIRLQ